MSTQPQLLDSSSPLNLPGPQFKPRPGWGGNLASWWRRDGRLVAFQLALLITLGLIARSVWVARTPLMSTPTATPLTNSITQTPTPGESGTHFATRILTDYLAQYPPTPALDAAQRLFIVTTFTHDTMASLKDLIQRAQALTPSQRALWARYLPRQ